MTVSDLLKGSLRLIGVLATGETMSAATQVDALSVLNDMAEAWAVEGLLIHKVTREEFTLTVGQASRTMGTGGNFNTTRPSRIIRAGVIQNDIEMPIDVVTVDEWAEIPDKETQSDIPLSIYPEGTHPLETINIWPVPSEANSLVLYSEKPFTAFAVSDTLSLPPGYQRALRYNLAVELAPEYGKTPSELIMMAASESKTEIKRRNTKPVYMKSDAVGLSRPAIFNWKTGE